MKTSIQLSPLAPWALLAVLTSLAPAAVLPAAEAVLGKGELRAKWIWHAQEPQDRYNDTIVARRLFQLENPEQAMLRITADSFYRLFLNGHWVNDGPCRSWPEHYQYDVIDAAPYLVPGTNEIRVIARYYGVGDFHRVPKAAGLLAQLDVRERDGRLTTIATDGSWEVAAAVAWISPTPKVSIQMEPCEVYWAGLEGRHQSFAPAAVRFAANAGPWKGLNPRDVALMTKQPFALKSFVAARVVRADLRTFCLPAARLVHPGLIEANNNVSMACGMATILDAPWECTVSLQAEAFRVTIDGQRNPKNEFRLAPGRHLVLALVRDPFGHEKEKTLSFVGSPGGKLVNPLKPDHENPWCLLRFTEFAVATNDMLWINFKRDDPRLAAVLDGYPKLQEQLLKSVKDLDGFKQHLGARAEVMPSEAMFVTDFHRPFLQRQVIGDASEFVSNPAALMHDTPEATTIRPSPRGNIELLYDLGEQNCGYYDFELVAEADVMVDIFGLEYITPDGTLQHTGGNRNGLRYITKQGVNRFTSLKRRSGRYLFITLRNQKAPVQIRHFQLIESTYPVNAIGSFSCSDARLDRIWDISTRTLKLCMEDTYTDCPLYEQTHWVGDARNESLFGYGVFGAHDLARRCINITAQSLEHYPIAGCQTPSSWDCLLPAWSFLWGISTWDYYWATADKEWLRGVFPAVILNLRRSERFVNDRDLFSGPFWNFFDWVNIDQGPKTVLHNSMFIVGAIDAALKEAEVLGDTTHTRWLKDYRARLVRGINRLWDPAKKTYPDAIRDDGSISPSTCQHTSFLSLLYDIIEKDNAPAAVKNLTDPPAKMVRPGSPFAVLYLYETYERLGMEDEIIKDTYKNYLPMLEDGATTVWESFPSGTTGGGKFPTRSHCHAWSSAPTRFLNRIVLGVKDTAPGAATVQISPRLNGLSWARGATATWRGPVSVSWKVTGSTLDVKYTAPASVKAEFVKNDTHKNLTVVVNGTTVE
jgi:alpha-L-rhamnosidase